MKKILITGAAGFLGSHLANILVKDKQNHVFGIDNLQTGRLKNLNTLLNEENFDFIQQDIIEPINLKEIDEIYNLACPASPPLYQLDPIHTFKTSIFGIINILELAKCCKSKVLHASTSEVYGDPVVHPQDENYWGNVNPIGIRSCYDEGKRAAETACFDYRRYHNLDVKLIRIFNTYGPNMNPLDGRVVSNFIVQALQNKDITIYGSGNQTRSFQYYSDLLNGMNLVMSSNDFGPFNIGNPIEFTIKELALKVIELTKSKSKIIYLDLPSDDPRQRKPDITKIKETFNWSPVIHLEEGLIKTIEYFKSELDIE